PPRPTLFPYTTLFRSLPLQRRQLQLVPFEAGQSEVENVARLDVRIGGAQLRLARRHLRARPVVGFEDQIAQTFLRAPQLPEKLRSEEHTSELQSLRHL